MPLPVPKGRQKEVLSLPAEGHIVVLGTAGSGKTNLAMHRAAYLQRIDPQSKTLLVTFNNALVTYLQSEGGSALNNVDVRTYHKFARGYLNFRSKMRQNSIIKNDFRLVLIKKAIKEIKLKLGSSSTLNRPQEVFAEEIKWITRSGIQSLEHYIKVERIGRQGTRIARKDRKIFWAVYQRYIQLRTNACYDYDWNDIAQTVISEFIKDDSSNMYKHIIIDEGQDFSPTMLKSLALAIPSDGSLTFFGDMAQQIYGTRISWRSAGLKPPKVWEFKENYRNSKQIAKFALAISNMPYFTGVPDIVEPNSPFADGPPPTIVECKNKNEETRLIIEQTKKLGRTQSVAIILRDRDNEGTFLKSLPKYGLRVIKLHKNMTRWIKDPCVYVGTYYSAKGLEFDAVILPYCSDEILPSKSRIIALDSKDEAMSEEGQLLYVGVTRAKARLIIIYSGNITPLIPPDTRLYKMVKS